MKKVALQCRNCGNMKYIEVKSGFTTFKIPRQCDNSKLIGEQREKCPPDFYVAIFFFFFINFLAFYFRA